MVWALPVGELEDAFFRQPIGTRIECVEGLAHFVDHVSPPLRTLTVRAVHVGVPHGDVEGAQRLLAVAIQELIVAFKGSCELAVVTRLAVLEGEDFESQPVWYSASRVRSSSRGSRTPGHRLG